MGAVAFVFRAELRGRWRSWLAIALLVAVVGGFVLAATAAGRRTTSAYPQFVATYGYDATVFATRQVPQLERFATVASATAMVSPSNGQPTCLCTHPINVTSANFAVLAEPRGESPSGSSCPAAYRIRPLPIRSWRPSRCSAMTACRSER